MDVVVVTTAPFSLADALLRIGIAAIIVAFVAAAAFAWSHRGDTSDKGNDNLADAARIWCALTIVLFTLPAFVMGVAHSLLSDRHVVSERDYSSYGVYEGTVERATLTDFTVRTDYGAVLTNIPYDMASFDGPANVGDRVSVNVSRMALSDMKGVDVRGGDGMGVKFLWDETCKSPFYAHQQRVPVGAYCHGAFGDVDYKQGSVYYILTGVSRL